MFFTLEHDDDVRNCKDREGERKELPDMEVQHKARFNGVQSTLEGKEIPPGDSATALNCKECFSITI